MFEAAQSYSALIKVLPLIHAIHSKSADGCLKLHRSTVHLFEPEPLFVPSALKKDKFLKINPYLNIQVERGQSVKTLALKSKLTGVHPLP